MLGNEDYWLEMKIQIEEENPILRIEQEFKEKICRVDPHIYPLPKGGRDLVSIEVQDESVFSKVRQFIETNYTSSIMEYIWGSEKLKQGKVVFYSWIKSPSYDLIRECLLIGYSTTGHNPSEHFLVYYKDKGFLLKVLRKTFEKTKAKIEKLEDRMDWIIRDSITPSCYSVLTLFQNYKYAMALDNNFFQDYDVRLLDPLIKEIMTVTREKCNVKILVDELKIIEKKVFSYLISKISK